MGGDQLEILLQRLERVETMLAELVRQRATKEWYSTAEAAQVLDRAVFTIREWCRLRRVHAEKRRCGRGRSQEWMIAFDELVRIQNEGLLPED